MRDKASVQKDLSPEGFAKDGSATSLLLSAKSEPKVKNGENRK
jgi:hypothetical protein